MSETHATTAAATSNDSVTRTEELLAVTMLAGTSTVLTETSIVRTMRKPKGGGGGTVTCQACVTTVDGGVRTQSCVDIPCPKATNTAPSTIFI